MNLHNLFESDNSKRKQNALWAQITDYEKRAKATSNDIKKQHLMQMADRLRGQLKTSDNIEEGDVVQFPKKHKGDLDSVQDCPKCGGDLQGGTYMGHKVKVCIPCSQVYLPPNSGIDQKGNKIKEQSVAEGRDMCNVCGQTPCNCTHIAEGWDPDTTRLEQDVRDALENGDDYTAKQYAKMAPTPEAKKYLLNIIKQAMYIDDLGGETNWNGVEEGKEDKIAQLKKDHATAVHWSKNDTNPHKREAARQKADKIKAHLEKQYKQGVSEMDGDGAGRDGSNRKRIGSYGTRDRDIPGPDVHLGPEHALTRKQTTKKMGDVLDKEFEKSHKKGVSEVSDTTLKNYKRTSAGDVINRQNIANRTGKADPKIAKRNAGQERAEKKLQGVAEGELDEKSTSQAQFRTMAAAAHNPKFAKKVGISGKVAKEFHKADRKQDYKDLPARVDETHCNMTNENELCPIHGLAECGMMIREAVSSLELAQALFTGLEQKYPDVVRNFGHEVVGDAVMDAAEDSSQVRSMSDIDMIIDDIYSQLAGANDDEFSSDLGADDDMYEGDEEANETMMVAAPSVNINEARMYYNVVGTSTTDLRSDFGMRKDQNGWFLTAKSGSKRIMEAQRAFGTPKVEGYDLAGFSGSTQVKGPDNEISPIGTVPKGQIKKAKKNG